MKSFNGATIFILASNEKQILKDTLDEIIGSCGNDDISRIIVALKSEDCISSTFLKNCILNNEKYRKVGFYIQQKPGIVQCMAELPPLVKSSHFLIMGADNEMSPGTVKDLITNAKEYPDTIICAAKWRKDSLVAEKKDFHLFGSFILNRLSAVILHCKACDPCSIFRIYPVEVFSKLPSGNTDCFLYEYTLKPLAFGMKYREIPTVFRKRTENQSNFNYLDYFIYAFDYLKFALKYRKMAKYQARR